MLLDKVLNLNLPQLHLPGTNYCGPYTRDLNRKPLNTLDAFCREHDLSYLSKDFTVRHEADKKLADSAFHLVKSKKVPLKERLTSALVGSAMYAKHRLGAGFESRMRKKGKGKKRVGGNFRQSKLPIFLQPLESGNPTQRLRKRRHNAGKRRRVKRGGFLPILAGLAGLAAAATQAVKNINEIRLANKAAAAKTGSGFRGRKRRYFKKTSVKRIHSKPTSVLHGSGVYLPTKKMC